jgi:catechol 2,3-dioxygenase-like lactoylglutathione lyase family enzyme
MPSFRRLAVALILALASFAAAAAARAQPADLAVTGITLTVDDLDRAVPFYRDALSFTPVDTVEAAGTEVARLVGVFGARMQVVTLRLGQETIALAEFRAPQGRPIPPDARSNDLWFQHIAIVVRDMDQAHEQLESHDVASISTAPQTLPKSIPAAAGISAFYFRDPAGNPLELIHFPPDKGAARWQRATDALFLGIDHTAIATRDTEESLAFYRDQLGFTVAGGSVNFGAEQERLTGVFGARIRITALRPPGGGIGVELLDYQAPRTGRPMPADTRASDLWHVHIRIQTDALDALTQSLLDGGHPFVSPGIVDMDDDAPFTFERGAMARDPSGHALLLTTPPSTSHN